MTPTRHRGSAYLAILGACTLVAIIGFSALIAARVQLRSANLDGNVVAARAYARSGLEFARLTMSRDANWRRNFPNGVWFENMAIDRGAFTVEAFDPVDNDLSNWPTDPVVMTVSGFAGGARQIQRITLVPEIRPLSCLEVAAISDGNFNVNSGTLSSDQTLGTNANFSTAGSSQVDARVEAGGSITGSGYLGTKLSGVARREIPTADAAIQYYLANATVINYNALGGGSIQDALLSPTNNPWGPTNPHGIYVIDCAGRTFRIRDSRIVGTLIVLDPKDDSTIEGSVNIAPAIAGLPVLLIRGPMNFQFVTSDLVEGSGRNYNPPGTPYNSVSNNTTTDRYPSRMDGLIYLSGNGTLNNCGPIRGVLIAMGSLHATGTLNLAYDPACRQNPPPGFCHIPHMLVQPGSARRIVQ